MKNIYLFSGLGADHRAFKKLDFSGYNFTFVEWIKPEKNETIDGYAKRLLKQIETENPILIGLSFGGVMAIEVSKHIKTEKLIIISSIKKRADTPVYYKWIAKLGLHKLAPAKFYKKHNFITNWVFGVQGKEDKETLYQILKDTDACFLKWAMQQMFNWQNTSIRNNLVHIHGTKDRILPAKKAKPDIIIENGGHLMVLNKAEEISHYIRKIISNN